MPFDVPASRPLLVDSHCHLDFPDFQGEVDGVVARARDAGVAWMLTIGTHVTRFGPVAAIAEAHPDVFCTVGIHPHNAGTEPAVSVDDLVSLAAGPKVVGFGETGLDYFYDHSPRDAQQRQFRTHIAAARAAGLPLVVHTRDAEDDTRAILDDEMGQGAFTGLLHCFSGSAELARAALDLGFYLSFSGIVTFKKANALRAIAAEVPLDRLLVETDAPYLAPVPKRGGRNEPAYVVHTAARLADIKGIGLDDLAAASSDNFFRLFAKAVRS